MATGEPQFTAIHTTDDRIEAELFRSTLEAEGLDVRVTGFADAALLGAAPGILPITLSVPAADVEKARALIAALEQPAQAEAELPPEYHDPEPAETGRPRAQQRRPYLAAGLVFFLPGAGHLYARRPWTGLMLALGWVVVIALASSWKTSQAAGGLVALLLACDAIGGVRAARTYNRGVDVGRGRQLAIGAVLVFASVGLSQGAAAIDAFRRARIARELDGLQTSCTARTLVVTNRGPETRHLSVTPIRIAEERHLIGISRLKAVGVTRASLAPGQAITLELDWVDGGTARCGSSGGGVVLQLALPGACSIEYDVIVRDAPDGAVLATAEWSCAF